MSFLRRITLEGGVQRRRAHDCRSGSSCGRDAPAIGDVRQRAFDPTGLHTQAPLFADDLADAQDDGGFRKDLGMGKPLEMGGQRRGSLGAEEIPRDIQGMGLSVAPSERQELSTHLVVSAARF
jgi:hypothetical protein